MHRKTECANLIATDGEMFNRWICDAPRGEDSGKGKAQPEQACPNSTTLLHGHTAREKEPGWKS